LGKPALSDRLVASLDLARAVAACYVVVHHFCESRNLVHGLGVVFRFGQEAVIIFFLLSGFVIFANERERALAPAGYYLRRLRRVYPILLIAMVLSAILAWDSHQFTQSFSLSSLIGTLLSVEDISGLKPGVIVDPFLANAPLWSLSYEVAFYLVFPPILMAWKRNTAITNFSIGLGCCLLYVIFAIAPNHFALVGSYFLIWWTGAMIAAAYLDGKRDVRSIADVLIWLIVLSVEALVVVRLKGSHGLGFYPVLMFRHFAFAAIVPIVLFGPVGRMMATVSSALAKPAAWVASISFGLYAFHVPLLVLWTRAYSPIGFALAVLILLGLAYVSERLLPKVLPKAPRT